MFCLPTGGSGVLMSLVKKSSAACALYNSSNKNETYLFGLTLQGTAALFLALRSLEKGVRVRSSWDNHGCVRAAPHNSFVMHDVDRVILLSIVLNFGRKRTLGCFRRGP